MKVVAQYALTTQTDHASAGKVLISLDSMVHEWLSDKGNIDENGWKFVDFRDGRRADLAREELKTSRGEIVSWTVTEPTASGRFRTSISLGYEKDVGVGVSCTLQAGNPVNVLMPVHVEAHCPRIVRKIAALPLQWKIRDFEITPEPMRCYGETGGRCFISLLKNPSRSLPVIALSQQRGFLLHPGLSGAMAGDLIGLAIVAELDDAASWEVTNTLGRDFSCFMGAVRIYWPFGVAETDPYRHPLWTPQRLLQNVGTTEEAAKLLRDQIRRLLFELSALSIEPPELFQSIRRTHLSEEAAARRKESGDTIEFFKALAEEYERDNNRLRDEASSQTQVIRQLRADLYNLQVQQAWRGGGENQLAPDNQEPPENVAEAIRRAKLVHVQFLTFGSDVERGLAGICPDAGPPDKILLYLGTLAELAETRRTGNLGLHMVDWLKENGCMASGESETIRNNRAEMAKRTWDDGRGPRQFNLHMKPSEATSPDRCVRIYFDWDTASEQVVVGWIGRHP